MDYLIEFAKNEPIGFAVFIFCALCICVSIGLLIIQNNTYYDEISRPPTPYKGVDNSDLNELLALATKMVSDNDNMQKPAGPPNTKLNGDPLDERGLPDNICGHINIGCTKYKCEDG